MELSDCNYGILQRNRARCALNKKILNLLALLEKAVVELVRSIAKILFKIFVCPPTYVTGSEKTAHFAQDFKIELLVL